MDTLKNSITDALKNTDYKAKSSQGDMMMLLPLPNGMDAQAAQTELDALAREFQKDPHIRLDPEIRFEATPDHASLTFRNERSFADFKTHLQIAPAQDVSNAKDIKQAVAADRAARNGDPLARG